MSNHLIRRIIILAALSVFGILFIQTYWLINTWDLKEEEFHNSVSISLRKVAENIASFNETELPKQELIQRRASNFYAVNINSAIDANVLEDFLLQEFQNRSLYTDFEYAVYDCSSNELVYGNYCKLGEEEKTIERSEDLPTFQDLIYYFVVKFPSKQSYILTDIWVSVMLSIMALLASLFFIYSAWIILKQKRNSEMQKEFINTMTHEFKTPLSSIKIAADVFLKNDQIKNDSRLHQYAEIIKVQTSKLNDQVEKVLNIARIEEKSVKIKKEEIDLKSALDRIAKTELGKFNVSDISLLYHAPSADIKIQADPLHFNNIITNILDNALKYSEAGDQVTLSYLDKDYTHQIKVSDTGIGIAPEHLKRIFDKFYRVSTGNIHNVKGFGLGLFYVKNICSAHQWNIHAESKLNIGTTITITIPK